MAYRSRLSIHCNSGLFFPGTWEVPNTDMVHILEHLQLFTEGTATVLCAQVLGYRLMTALGTEAGVATNLRGPKDSKQAVGAAVSKRKRPEMKPQLSFF